MKKDILFPLRRLHGVLHEKRQNVTEWLYYTFPIDVKNYVVGTPSHTNIGDSAIALAEIQFIKKINGKSIKEATVSECNKYKKYIKITSKSHFFGMGGVTWAISGTQRRLFAKSLLLSN